MLREIGKFLSSEGFAIGIAFTLWLLLYDENAMQRVKEGKTKKLLYSGIFGYFLLLLVNVVKIIMKYSS